MSWNEARFKLAQLKRGLLDIKGGPGSGNWGHEGRPGERGGSGAGGGHARVGITKEMTQDDKLNHLSEYAVFRAQGGQLDKPGALPEGIRKKEFAKVNTGPRAPMRTAIARLIESRDLESYLSDKSADRQSKILGEAFRMSYEMHNVSTYQEATRDRWDFNNSRRVELGEEIFSEFSDKTQKYGDKAYPLSERQLKVVVSAVNDLYHRGDSYSRNNPIYTP